MLQSLFWICVFNLSVNFDMKKEMLPLYFKDPLKYGFHSDGWPETTTKALLPTSALFKYLTQVRNLVIKTCNKEGILYIPPKPLFVKLTWNWKYSKRPPKELLEEVRLLNGSYINLDRWYWCGSALALRVGHGHLTILPLKDRSQCTDDLLNTLRNIIATIPIGEFHDDANSSYWNRFVRFWM